MFNLGIKRTKYTWVAQGKRHYVNLSLAKSRGLTCDDVENIVRLHRALNKNINAFKKKKFKLPFDYKLMRDNFHFVHSQLQRLWKFPDDKTYHPFWELPYCTCPKLDNEELQMANSTLRYHSSDCPYHGTHGIVLVNWN